MQTVPVRIQRVRDNNDLPLPAYKTEGSAGFDLRADIQEPILLKPLQRKLVPTGIAIEIPIHCEAQVRARSGLSLKHGIGLVNAPGTIDADYRGEIQVILINLSDQDFTIERGERIAQIVINPIVHADFQEVSDLSQTERGSGGFGSTGTS